MIPIHEDGTWRDAAWRDAASSERKIRRIGVQTDLLVATFQDFTALFSFAGVPDGSVLVGSRFDPHDPFLVWIFVEHPSFDPVPDGVEIPELTVYVRRKS